LAHSKFCSGELHERPISQQAEFGVRKWRGRASIKGCAFLGAACTFRVRVLGSEQPKAAESLSTAQKKLIVAKRLRRNRVHGGENQEISLGDVFDSKP